MDSLGPLDSGRIVDSAERRPMEEQPDATRQAFSPTAWDKRVARRRDLLPSFITLLKNAVAVKLCYFQLESPTILLNKHCIDYHASSLLIMPRLSSLIQKARRRLATWRKPNRHGAAPLPIALPGVQAIIDQYGSPGAAIRSRCELMRGLAAADGCSTQFVLPLLTEDWEAFVKFVFHERVDMPLDTAVAWWNLTP